MKIGTSTVTAIYLGTTSIVSAYLGSTQVFGGTSAFTPLDLFSGGSQGIWLDPSDLTTMFSDRAGTTPVTTPGTVVGLRLDKSKGLALGAELVSNPGPFTTTTGWTHNGTSLTASGGNLVFVASALTSAVNVAVSGLTVGVTYSVTTNVVSFDAGGTIRADDSANLPSPVSSGNLSVGAVKLVFVANLATMYVGFRGFAAGQGITFSSFSVRELPGNHATAPTDAARPIYGVEPKGGRRNLLTWSEGFDNAAWTKAGIVVTADQSAGPVSGSLADRLLATSSSRVAYQSPTLIVGQAYILSAYIKRNAATDQGFLLFGNVGSTSSADFVATDSWQRFQLTFTATGTGGVVGIADNSAAQDYDILVYGAQLELGSTATPYQKVTTAYDVTESGVATCHYVQYDGSDDSMSTAAIDFTATDKMSIFAGVRKIFDGQPGVILELSASVGSNNGSFAIFAPRTNGEGSIVSDLRGTSGAFRYYTGVSAPVSLLVSALYDIAGATVADELILRNNSIVQAGTSGGPAGTGNFGNYPLYIGRRNNATLPFNGRDFGIIIVGKAASAGEITDTETWLAARTAQVTL